MTREPSGGGLADEPEDDAGRAPGCGAVRVTVSVPRALS